MALSLPNCSESVRHYRRRPVPQSGATAHATEDEEVEEVHRAQDEQDHTHFYGEGFDTFFSVGHVVTEF
jgi:hypothetical protein